MPFSRLCSICSWIHQSVVRIPTRIALARNPWANFVRYESEVAAKLEELGRDNFFQPDAARGAGTYHTWNYYQYDNGVINFGEPDLFQPWSVASKP